MISAFSHALDLYHNLCYNQDIKTNKLVRRKKGEENMNAIQFHKLLRKAVAYYTSGAPEYTRMMDELSINAEEGQWEMVQEALREVDEFMSESAIGTLAQKEESLAMREGRRSRYPLSFELNEARYEKITALKREFTERGIKFRHDGEELYRSEWEYVAILLEKDVKRQKDERTKRIVHELLSKVKTFI